MSRKKHVLFFHLKLAFKTLPQRLQMVLILVHFRLTPDKLIAIATYTVKLQTSYCVNVQTCFNFTGSISPVISPICKRTMLTHVFSISTNLCHLVSFSTQVTYLIVAILN